MNHLVTYNQQDRIAEVEKFFNLLFGKVHERKFGYLWAKKGDDKKTYPFDVSTADNRRAMAQKAIELSDAGFDVYYGVNLMDTPPAPYARVTAEHVTLQTATVTDIDILGGTHTNQKKYPPTFDAAKSFLPFEASILIDSGYGLHGLNLYEEPIIITADNREACKKRNTNYIDVIRSRAGEYSDAADSVGDLPRVLRCPGTFNYKLGRDNAPLCHLVEVNDIHFTPESMDERLNALMPARPVEEKQAVKKKRQSTQGDFPEDKDYDMYRARRMLDFISPSSLTYDDWLAVGMTLKNIGMSCSDWEQWSRADERFKDGECESKWNGFNRDGLGIGTICDLAKSGGYDPKTTWHEFHDKPKNNNFDSEPSDAIRQWQIDNGEIEPNLLFKLKADAERIKNISDFAAAAKDTSTQKILGAFQYYSYFISLRDNFFILLKQKKEQAAEKIKEYNSLKRNETLRVELSGDSTRDKIAALTPTEQDLALIEVNITATKNIVNTYETEARKAHKDYLLNKKIEELNAKYQAEREAYELDPPTTQKKVPDCPIDLGLPLGVYFDDREGIRIVDYDKPVGKKGRPVIEACKNLVVPIRAFREVTKRGENPKSKDQYEIAIKTYKNWRRVIVDGRTLIDPRKVMELADYGLYIVDAKFTAKFFAKIIAHNESNGRLKVTKIYLQPGWQDKNFKFFAYPTGGNDYIVKNADFDYQGIFTPQGNKDAWKKMLHRVIYHDPKNYSPNDVVLENADGTRQVYSKDNNPSNFSAKPNLIAAMILGSSFAAPLVGPLGIRNPQMVLGFDSGNGKTAAAKFAVSFFGDPFELCPTCNATENFLEDLAVKLNDFPHGVDELQAAKKHIRENMDELVYKFSGGTTRGRADIQGNAKPIFHYRGFRLFTGEQTIINNSSGQGALSRVFEIRKPDLFADPFAIEIHNFTQNNFGFFGKYYTTEFIPNNLDRIKKQYDTLREVFCSDSFNLLSSHATFLAYAFTGLQFGLEACGYSEEDALKITFDTLENVQDLIDDAPDKLMAKNINRALPDLLNFVEAHPKNFAKENEYNLGGETKHDILPAEGNETFGITLMDGRIAFNPLCLRRIISEELQFPSARQIINGFADANLFDSENTKHKKHMKRLPAWINEKLGKTSWFYILKAPEAFNQSLSA